MSPEWWSAVTQAPAKAASAVGSAVGAAGGALTGGLGDVEQTIRRVAGEYKFSDPDLLVATARQESGLNPQAVGDQGKSVGVFQEHIAGRGAGLSAVQRQDVAAATARAIQEFNTIRQRNPNADRGTWAALAQRPYDARGYAQSVNAMLSTPQTTSSPSSPPSGGSQPAWWAAIGSAAAPARAPAALKEAATSPDQPAWWGAVGGGQPAPSSQSGTRQNAPATADPAEQARPGQTPQWLQIAESQLGKPYIWGSAGGRSNFNLSAPGYDCSGFVAQVYRNAFGVDIPAFTGSAYPVTKAVSQQEAQPGDLVFWNMNTSDPRRQHIAIYAGGGKVIQSGGAGDGVNIAPVTQMPGAEFRRMPAAYALYGGGSGQPGAQMAATAPAKPQSYQLQGADAPAWWASVAR